ncbi:hypothetical protein, partial [Streptomyces sp. WAC00303]
GLGADVLAGLSRPARPRAAPVHAGAALSTRTQA